MRKTSFAAGIGTALLFSLCVSSASIADDSAKAPSTGSVKPNLGSGPASQKSLSSSASPAKTTATTGATDQNNTVKTMNSNEKAKVETGGK